MVPEITAQAREIYARGLQLGNNPRAFSKVGDCQGIKEVLLGVYDQPALYTLGAENAYLQQTIDWFAGSFNRNGYAVMGGFNARAVLQPSVADPAACRAGENPIECEYRQHRPSIVLVSLEFYYDGRTAQNYEQYLRQILNFFITRGVVPILATKADNVEGDDSLNLTTAKLALEYDLPLWNFWLAVQALPNKGMDITRPDGFHISVDAWRVRSFTALQAIDAVWRGVRDLACQGAGCFSPRPSATATATPPPATRLVLGLAERKDGATQSRGVYLLDTQAQSLTPLLDGRYAFQAASPDGIHLLVNQGEDLYNIAVDGSNPIRLGSGFFAVSPQGAVWLADGKSAVVIARRDPTAGGGGERALWLVAPDGSVWRRLTPPGGPTPYQIFPSADLNQIYWAAEAACSWSDCGAGPIWVTPLDGSASFSLEGMSRLWLAPDGKGLAYTYLTEKGKTALALTTFDRLSIWTPLPEGYVLDASWSPSGRWLAALWEDRSDYSGKATGMKVYLLSPAENRRDEFGVTINLNGQMRWSPDGRYLLVTGTEYNSEGYRLNLRLVPVNGGPITILDGKISPSAPEFIYITHIEWLAGK